MSTVTHPEAVRQQYLKAMGITVWLPHRPLPSAAPSPQWCWQPLTALAGQAPEEGGAAQDRATRESTVQPVQERPVTDVRALVGLASAEAKTVSPAPRKSAVVEPERNLSPVSAKGVTASQTEVPRFRILVVRFADCLVLDDLPLDTRQPVTPSHQTLLMAILDAVGLGKGPAQEQIASWPLFAADSGHDQSMPVARQLLQLDVGLADLPGDTPLLLLGKSASEVLLASEDTRPFVVRGPSLNEMLRIPSCKADLWRALQPLRRRG